MIYQNILQKTKDNNNFREVVFTNEHSQFVMMTLQPGEEIGLETHGDVDQILYFVEGGGTAKLNGEEMQFEAGDVANVPAGTEHNFTNTGDSPLRIFTVYSPPEHPDGTINKDKASADLYEAEHHH